MSRCMADQPTTAVGRSELEVSIPPVALPGTLRIPHGARAIVVFAHGSG